MQHDGSLYTAYNTTHGAIKPVARNGNGVGDFVGARFLVHAEV
jgi:hypothetical protein